MHNPGSRQQLRFVHTDGSPHLIANTQADVVVSHNCATDWHTELRSLGENLIKIALIQHHLCVEEQFMSTESDAVEETPNVAIPQIISTTQRGLVQRK
jgi:hypothetical protein